MAGIISEDTHDFMVHTVLRIMYQDYGLEGADLKVGVDSSPHAGDGDVLISEVDRC